MPRPPLGDKAMTDAERQRKRRARLRQDSKGSKSQSVLDEVRRLESALGDAQSELYALREADRLKALLADKPGVKSHVLPKTAQQKLDAAIKRERAKLEAELATLKAGVQKEVDRRIIEENAPYVATLRQRDNELFEKQQWYDELINDHKPPFTETEFMTIWRCLHSDSRASLTTERLNAAFALFNSKRRVLTGQRK